MDGIAVQSAAGGRTECATAPPPVSVSLESSPELLALTVLDGRMRVQSESVPGNRGLGLTSMRERLKLVVGELVVNSTADRGTTVVARVPLQKRHFLTMAAATPGSTPRSRRFSGQCGALVRTWLPAESTKIHRLAKPDWIRRRQAGAFPQFQQRLHRSHREQEPQMPIVELGSCRWRANALRDSGPWRVPTSGTHR